MRLGQWHPAPFHGVAAERKIVLIEVDVERREMSCITLYPLHLCKIRHLILCSSKSYFESAFWEPPPLKEPFKNVYMGSTRQGHLEGEESKLLVGCGLLLKDAPWKKGTVSHGKWPGSKCWSIILLLCEQSKHTTYIISTILIIL